MRLQKWNRRTPKCFVCDGEPDVHKGETSFKGETSEFVLQVEFPLGNAQNKVVFDSSVRTSG